MNTATKKSIVKELAEETALTQVQVKEIVQGFMDKVRKIIVRSGRIELRNFGILYVQRRAARKARNPRTGVTVSVPAKKTVCFRPGALVKAELNN